MNCAASEEVKKWSPRKGLELIIRFALRKWGVGAGMEQLVILQLEKQVMVCFERLTESSHSSALLSVCEPWSVQEVLLLPWELWWCGAQEIQVTVLYKPN